MTADKLARSLLTLEAAEEVLLDLEDWASAAHLSLVIDRMRRAHGLADRPPVETERAEADPVS